MSKEEVNLIKDEIYQKIREFENKINKELNDQKAEMNSTYNKFNEKISSILNNNREMIESVVSEKINIEKLHALENFKNKADGMLISHEIRINNHNKDINNMKTKYDKAMIDNLTVPGFIGPSCQYKNIGEYILENRNEFSRFKYDKENLKQEIKDIKIKLDNIFKQTLSLVDNSIERCKEYTNGKILEYNKHFDTKFEEFEERSMEIRLELQQAKSDIEEKVNNLRLETGKLLIMKEKFVTIDENIEDINNKIDKINCDTKKLNEKNDGNDKILEKLRKDVEKMKKFIAENRSKNKDKEKNKKKEKRYEYTKEFINNNSVNRKKSDGENNRLSQVSLEDRGKFSELENSPIKPKHVTKKNINIYKSQYDFLNEKKNYSLFEESPKKRINNSVINYKDSEEIKEKKISKKKEERKNDYDISHNDNNNVQILNKKDNYNIVDNKNNINFVMENKLYSSLTKENDAIIEKKEEGESINSSNSKTIHNTVEKPEANININNNGLENIKNDDKKIISNFDEGQSNKKEIKLNKKEKENKLSFNNIDNNINLNIKDNQNIDYNYNQSIKKAPMQMEKQDNIELGMQIKNIKQEISYNQFEIENNKIPIINNDKSNNNIQENNSNIYISNNIVNNIKPNNHIISKDFNINNKDNNIITKNNIVFDNNNNILNNNDMEIKNNLNINNEKKIIGNYNIINNHNYEIANNDNNFNNKKYNNKNNINAKIIDKKSINESKSSSMSNINDTTSQIYNSISNSNRSSSKTIDPTISNKDYTEKEKNFIKNNISNKYNKNNSKNKHSNIFNQYTKNSKKILKTFEATQWNGNINEHNNAIRKTVSPYLQQAGVNLVGLNVGNAQEDDDYDNIRISFSGNKLKDLRLEGIGVYSPNSQKVTRKKIRLQGISTEAPLKISAAFGRTAYTFIDKNNEKNQLYSIKLAKKNKSIDKNSLNIYFAPNNK